MLVTFSLPTGLFLGIPAVVVSGADPKLFALLLLYLSPLLLGVFGTGYLLAPTFGRRVLSHRGFAFALAAICLAAGLIDLLVSAHLVRSLAPVGASLILLLPVLVYSIPPALIGGALFLGACGRLHTRAGGG